MCRQQSQLEPFASSPPRCKSFPVALAFSWLKPAWSEDAAAAGHLGYPAVSGSLLLRHEPDPTTSHRDRRNRTWLVRLDLAGHVVLTGFSIYPYIEPPWESTHEMTADGILASVDRAAGREHIPDREITEWQSAAAGHPLRDQARYPIRKGLLQDVPLPSFLIVARYWKRWQEGRIAFSLGIHMAPTIGASEDPASNVAARRVAALLQGEPDAATVHRSRRPGRKPLSDEEVLRVAIRYERAGGKKPVKDTARSLHMTENEVKTRMKAARARGWFDQPGQGASGGTLTPAGRHRAAELDLVPTDGEVRDDGTR